ncbi:glycosyltransferase family 4 protein [Nostoc cycadae]|uniref:Glycosyl transferase family 1 n=1 Tax=Nostoc cycadae WK-1 TaxID=1861711 RepID=A0A2H6LHU2_9NOSO|nr:glycosyltransferase family 4 protein [Nostoc cycadae]GBE92791.1 glycosyl transferase family 1 [Nostoc cycadae WK-1]
MKIAHVNTYDIQGGAARGAYRLHQGLRRLGQDSLMLVKHKHSTDPTVHSIPNLNINNINEYQFEAIQNSYINRNRTTVSNTLFSFPYPGIDISKHQEILNADIINLHWIAYFQSSLTLKKVFSLSKPVVWKFPDMWPFTGGCHYSAGCDKYKKDCVKCPQLTDDTYNLPAILLKDKLELWSDSNLTIVTPSHWMAENIKQSTLFKNNRIEVIPNSLDTNAFFPLSKAEAKNIIGVNQNDFIILFGAHTCYEKRKGFAELLTALHHCLDNNYFYKLVSENKIKLVCFGYPPAEAMESIPIPLLTVGFTDSDQKLQEVYSAADIFIQPALEENFGFTTIESMSCSTPVIGFDVGVVPDVVKDGITGKIIPVGDTHKMAEAIIECVLSPQHCKLMGENSRKLVEEEYPLTVQAKRYIELYEDLVNSHNKLLLQFADKTINKSSDKTNTKVNANQELATIPLDIELGNNLNLIFDKLALKALLAECNHQKQSIQELRNNLHNSQSQLEKTQAELHQTHAELHQIHTELHQTQAELYQVKIDITAMESSKFWKLRQIWFQLKAHLKLFHNGSF